MNVNVDKILASMFGLILLFLLLSRADATNTVIRAIGGFVTDQTRALQGLSPTNFTGQASYTLAR